MPGQWAGRPTPAARGYGPRHRQLRGLWSKRIQAGGVWCWRCKEPIDPNADWELGHDDEDRSKYKGPEHKTCNQTAGAAQGGRSRARANRPAEKHPGLL